MGYQHGDRGHAAEHDRLATLFGETVDTTDAAMAAAVNTDGTASRAAVDARAAAAVDGQTDAKVAVLLGTAGSDTRVAADGLYVGKGSLVLNVKDYGAVGDGVADDTLAIQAALAAATAAGRGHVYLPPGRYLITDTLAVTSKVWLVGAGTDVSVITSTSATLTSVTMTGQTPAVRLLTITKDVNPGGSGYGIDAGTTTDGAVIEHVRVEKHFIGVRLGGTGLSRMQNALVQWCASHGVFLSNAASTVASLQWYLTNVLSQGNTGDGFRVQSAAGKGVTSVGKISHCYTFANSGRGMIVAAAALSDRIAAIRISDCFFGQDGNDELYLDTYSGTHQIANSYFELAGSMATGPGIFSGSGSSVTAAQSNAGNGIVLTANNATVSVAGCQIVQNSRDGIYTSAADAVMVGNHILSNGRALVASARYGIHIAAGNAQLVGNRVRNTGGVTYQEYGLNSAVADVIRSGNNWAGNATGGVTGTAPTITPAADKTS